MSKYKSLVKLLKFNQNGFIPAIVQDYKTREILMLGWMNREAIARTIETKKSWFYSRSRNKLWMKGEISGNVQQVKEIYIDCDGDCILLKVNQVGNASCHKGYSTCFYRKLTGRGKLKIVRKRIFDPQKVYR